jgi:hypothetical protein
VVLSFTRVLHLTSIVVSLIVLASFVLFAVNQTSTASAHQQEVVNSSAGPAAAPAAARSSTPQPEHIGAVHSAIDEAANALTSPFSGVTAGSTSQWTIHIVNLLLALAVYGFGFGFTARLIRVRL